METKNKYKSMVVDDDPAYIQILSKLLSREEDFELLATCTSAAEALNTLESNPAINVLFLDVQMPGQTGIELLQNLPEGMILKTILITSTPEFAVDAFALNVIDYLVKPIQPERFAQGVAKIRREFELDKISDSKNGRELFIKSGIKMIRINSKDIVCVEALSDYVIFIMANGNKHIIHSTMKAMENRLLPMGFVRVHRSFIINLDYVDSVEDKQIKMGKKVIPVSKTYQDEFYSIIKARI